MDYTFDRAQLDLDEEPQRIVVVEDWEVACFKGKVELHEADGGEKGVLSLEEASRRRGLTHMMGVSSKEYVVVELCLNDVQISSRSGQHAAGMIFACDDAWEYLAFSLFDFIR